MATSRFEVRLSERAAQSFRGLPTKVQSQVKAKLQALQDDPRPHGSEKLKGSKNPTFYRLRAGDYRVIYHIDYPRRVVNVTKVSDRKDAY